MSCTLRIRLLGEVVNKCQCSEDSRILLRTDILLQYIFHVFLGVSTLDHQTLRSIYTTTRSQLGEQELHQVLGLSSHSSTDIGNVCKHRLFRALSVHLRRYQSELLLVAGKFRVVRV